MTEENLENKKERKTRKTMEGGQKRVQYRE